MNTIRNKPLIIATPWTGVDRFCYLYEDLYGDPTVSKREMIYTPRSPDDMHAPFYITETLPDLETDGSLTVTCHNDVEMSMFPSTMIFLIRDPAETLKLLGNDESLFRERYLNIIRFYHVCSMNRSMFFFEEYMNDLNYRKTVEVIEFLSRTKIFYSEKRVANSLKDGIDRYWESICINVDPGEYRSRAWSIINKEYRYLIEYLGRYSVAKK